MATDPLKTLRTIIDKHAADPRVRMIKLDETLRALQGAFDEVERRQGTLAASYLALLEQFTGNDHPHKLTMHAAQLDGLAAMSDHAGVIARRLKARTTFVVVEGGK